MATKKVAAPVKVVRPVGCQTVYTDAIADAICLQLADGLSLNAICRQPGMPSERTVRTWALDDLHGFAPRYAKARELGYLKLADELLDIADTSVIGIKTVSKPNGVETTEGDMIERSRLRVDTRKWMLSKMLPKIYGDKVSLEHSGNVNIKTMTDAELLAIAARGATDA